MAFGFEQMAKTVNGQVFLKYSPSKKQWPTMILLGEVHSMEIRGNSYEVGMEARPHLLSIDNY